MCSEYERQYFDIYIRRIEITKDNVIHDLLFYDITETIKSKQFIFQENFKKQRILAKIAHEFKTPINSIIGLISIIKEIIYKDKIRTLTTLNLIDNLSKYVIFLISDVIHYVNPNDINELKFDFEKLNLQDILKFCDEILKSLISCNRKKLENIKTELILDGNMNEFEIISDEIRLKQIILNLISNSVKFTNHGKIQIISKLINDENKIIISVVDTGIGIKEKNTNKIFTEFIKLEEVNSINKFGDGLGLSICKYLAKKLDIKITFESQVGVGTKFNLIINCRKNSRANTEFISTQSMIKNQNEHKNQDINLQREKKSLFKLKDDFENFDKNFLLEENSENNILFLDNLTNNNFKSNYLIANSKGNEIGKYIYIKIRFQ